MPWSYTRLEHIQVVQRTAMKNDPVTAYRRWRLIWWLGGAKLAAYADSALVDYLVRSAIVRELPT